MIAGVADTHAALWYLFGKLLSRILKDMEVHFTPEQEARLVQIATAGPELPVWHLGAVGSFHRGDIYDDAR